MPLKKVTPETQIKRVVKDYLKFKGYLWWWNLAGIGVYPGLPDICVLHKGILYMVEFKSEKGRLGPHQSTFLERSRECGAVPIVCRSLEDITRYL